MNKHTSKRKASRRGQANFSGQHFMHNKRIVKEIVNIAHISSRDLVLELGAGKGAITVSLSDRARKVIAVEYDDKLIEKLAQLRMENTSIIRQDMLNILLPREPFVVVSSIPYAITTRVMKMLFSNPKNSVQRAVIVMEKGAAKRFTSRFIKDAYVITWRMYYEICYVKEVSRKNFSPPPKVDSAIIRINRKQTPVVPINDYFIFQGLAEFMLKNPQLPIDIALRGIFTPPQMKHLKRTLQIKKDLSVGFLSETQWGIIFKTMVERVPNFRWPRAKRRKLNEF